MSYANVGISYEGSKLTWSELIQAMKQREQKKSALLEKQKENLYCMNT
jgi:hypothetical protein